MDEPLSNLDALLRLQARTELKRLHRDLKRTFVFVTHDQEEAMTLGTRIAILNQGRVIQFDSPRRIYHQPVTRFVAEFIGRPAMNVIDGTISEEVFRAGELVIPTPGRSNGPVSLGIRPEQIVAREASFEGSQPFEVDVMEVIEPDSLIFVRKGGASLVVRISSTFPRLADGAPVHLRFPREFLHFFDVADGRRRQ